MNHYHSKPRGTMHRQRGVALIIALILLLTMTLIGVTAMRTSNLEERMAGNVRDRNLAFQAAEAALREGETNLFNLSASQLAGILAPTVADPGNPGSYNWGDAEVYAGNLEQVSDPPVYVIERVLALGSEALGALDTSGIYRVTARGQGGTTDAVVVLQTTFRVVN